MSDAQKLRPFTIAVPEADLDDLLRRLELARFPGELPGPRVWAEKRYNLVHYTHQERGGHFAAFEQPALFAADLNAYAVTLRELAVV